MSFFLEEVEFAHPQYAEIVTLRTNVLRTPLGLSFTEDELSLEYNQRHFGFYNEKRELIGCAVLKLIETNHAKMRQVAVAKEYQKMGHGTAMISQLENWCRLNAVTSLELAAREEAVKFYLAMEYTLEGEPFVEVGIPHRHMSKKLV